MDRLQNKIYWTIMVSEMGHIFCCVLPTVFSLLSLLAGLGLVGALPAGYIEFHDVMHHWELPMIICSGVLLAFGWGLYYYSKKVDCRDTGCGHGPCTPKKKKSEFVLILATGLFVMNIAVYSVVHQDVFGMFAGENNAVSTYHSHDHGH